MVKLSLAYGGPYCVSPTFPCPLLGFVGSCLPLVGSLRVASACSGECVQIRRLEMMPPPLSAFKPHSMWYVIIFSSTRNLPAQKLKLGLMWPRGVAPSYVVATTNTSFPQVTQTQERGASFFHHILPSDQALLISRHRTSFCPHSTLQERNGSSD